MSSDPGLTTVESPSIGQLIRMGWKLVTGTLDPPSVTGHETLREDYLVCRMQVAALLTEGAA